MFENVEEPEARLNLALLGTEDALLAGTAAANDIFGAAPGAGSYGDARIGIAIVLHGSFSTILGSGASARNRWNRAESCCDCPRAVRQKVYFGVAGETHRSFDSPTPATAKTAVFHPTTRTTLRVGDLVGRAPARSGFRQAAQCTPESLDYVFLGTLLWTPPNTSTQLLPNGAID